MNYFVTLNSHVYMQLVTQAYVRMSIEVKIPAVITKTRAEFGGIGCERCDFKSRAVR